MAFLFYLTRSREADNCFRMLERVPLKWWLVAVPWIGPLGIAVTGGALVGPSLVFIVLRGHAGTRYNGALFGPKYFFLVLIIFTPLSLGLMLCLAYAVDFGAPSVESLEALKPKVRAFQAITEHAGL